MLELNTSELNPINRYQTLMLLLGLFVFLLPIQNHAQEYEEDKKVISLVQKIDFYIGKDNPKALELTNKLILYGEEVNNSSIRGIGSIRRAIVYDLRDNYKYSQFYFLKGVELLKSSENKKELAYAHHYFGRHYYKIQKYKEALEHFDSALQLYGVIGDEKSIQEIHIIRGRMFADLNQSFKALKLLKSAGSYFIKEHFDSLKLFQVHQYIASIYLKDEMIDSAFHYALISESFQPKQSEPADRADLNILLSKIYLALNQFPSSLKYAELSMGIAKENHLLKHEVEAVKSFSNIYYKLGRFKDSRDYLDRFHRLNDSLFLKKKEDEIYQIQSRYNQKLKEEESQRISEAEKKELELELVKLMQENQSQRQREFYIITVLILISILIIVMLRFTINRNKTAKTLKKKNSIIESALNEKDILIKEVHHRVKNNLQLIVSMMELDSINVQHPEARQKIRDTISRIQSIGIIHQRLYESEKVAEIDSEVYFQKLLDEITKSSQENVVFNSTIEHFTLDIDVGISFGLILNEMITNSIKYVDEKEIQIIIQFSRKNDNLIMSYSDNGTFDQSTEVKGTGFGLKLIKIMTRKLKGNLETDKTKGIKYKLTIENYFG